MKSSFFLSWVWATAISMVSVGCIRKLVKGNGILTMETRTISSFEGLRLSIGNTELYYTQGDVPGFKIGGDSNIVSLVETKIRGNILIINFSPLINAEYSNPIKIWVTSPTLSSIVNSGTAKVISEGKIMNSELAIYNSGSGSLQLFMDVEKLKVRETGSTGIVLNGTAKNFDCVITGSGGVNGKGLLTSNSKIRITGAGGCTIRNEEVLDVRISGSGSVRYLGNPTNIKKSISGSGNIAKEN
jgi:Putative auto-transporter adhesin, head GIN domain